MSNKAFRLLFVLVLALSGVSTSSVLAQGGCPDGLWIMMSSELASACAGEMAGAVVTVTGSFTGEDEVKFNESVAEFEAWTGIDIQYRATREFETNIAAAIRSGTAPDIADFSQPRLLRDLVEAGSVIDISTFMDADWLADNYLESWLDMSRMNGASGTITAGVWSRFNVKSLVWYPVRAFEANAYTVPQTWDEMLALSEQIIVDGGTPWCVGIESGSATGLVATDWLEEIMLRTSSLENYDNWSFPASAEDRLPFTDQKVVNAANILGALWFADNYVLGGRDGIVNTFFGDAPVPMFSDSASPDCYMLKEGNYITNFFPESVIAGDYNFFYLPPIDAALGRPFLVTGDIYAMFNDRPEVRATIDFFSRGESLRAWLVAGGALSPHNDASRRWYGSDIERDIATLASQATSVRFDGSDLMPGEVGMGAFGRAMTAWISGRINLDTALTEIDAAWTDN
jgi:alpha-glucoside transport system substrate-binding protein